MVETANGMAVSVVVLFTEGTGRAGGTPVFRSVGRAAIIL